VPPDPALDLSFGFLRSGAQGCLGARIVVLVGERDLPPGFFSNFSEIKYIIRKRNANALKKLKKKI
jgi:hypothetical protein